MIIVKLWGGLGNQMFQYAAARRLAYMNDAPLKLDLGWFDKIPSGDTPRQYALQPFNCTQDVASSGEVKALRGIDIRRWPKLLKRVVNSTGFFMKQTCIREKHFHFDPEILQLRGNVYLDGFWQSEKYFLDVADIIRKDFTIRLAPDIINCEISDSIRSCEAVSLHIRRGDYVSNMLSSNYHESSSLDYYKKAVAEMTARLNNPHFFLFSDEPEWVKNNLRLDVPMTFLEHNSHEKGYEDLRLMTLCRHHIIANSSFSWWGACLSDYPGKLVIAPKNWFKGDDIDTSDLLPESWLRL